MLPAVGRCQVIPAAVRTPPDEPAEETGGVGADCCTTLTGGVLTGALTGGWLGAGSGLCTTVEDAGAT